MQDCEVELLHPDLADERLKRRLGRLSLLGHLVQHAQVGDDGRRRIPGRVGPQRVLQRGDGFGQPASVQQTGGPVVGGGGVSTGGELQRRVEFKQGGVVRTCQSCTGGEAGPS